VINKHREVIYNERRKIIGGADLKANILSMVEKEVRNIVVTHTANEYGIAWEIDSLITDVSTIFPLPPTFDANALSTLKPSEMEDKLIVLAKTLYEEREKGLGEEDMRTLERLVMIRTIDNLWVEHLTMMENMRQGIGLQAMAQRDPLVAYKREGHRLFQNLLDAIQHDVVHTIYRVNILRKEATHPDTSPMTKATPAIRNDSIKKQSMKVSGKKIGRNDPCPCGSGKKYKKCCGG
jgi:preprotein translocase subunit SecA